MSNSKFLVIGVVIGVLIGAGALYVFSSSNSVSTQLAEKDSQIIDLQNQVIDLQSQLQQLQQQNSQANSTLAQQLLDLGASYTKYEKLEFTSAYAQQSSEGTTVQLNLKNTGSADATIDPSQSLLNGKPVTEYTPQPVCSFSQATLNPGQTTAGIITLPAGADWVSGMTVEITIHTIGEHDYPKIITIP